MRAIWSGSLSFGLINIPVRLYSATEDHAINFDMLHKTDLSPIRFARICKEEEKEVPYKDIVKGYEYQPGEYIVISDDDFKSARAGHSDTIEIINFSNEKEIDTIYFEKPYFLEPGKGANKGYTLLREALHQSKKVGIVKFSLKDREHLGIIKPFLNGIILDQLRFADQIKEISELKLPDQEMITKKEVEMALKLIAQLTEEFDPKIFHDNYMKELKEIIERKTHEQPLKSKRKSTQTKSPKVHDIISLLKASLKEDKASKSSKKNTKPLVIKKQR